jgi:hypothetical protein
MDAQDVIGNLHDESTQPVDRIGRICYKVPRAVCPPPLSKAYRENHTSASKDLYSSSAARPQ